MKILCITNNPISLDNANGKFIRNYLYSFSKDELLNFYITNDEKARGINSFNLSNFAAFKKLITFGIYKIKKQSQRTNNNGIIRNTSSPLKHLFRYFVWNTGFWKTSGFNKWIKQSNITHIVLALADNPYLIKLSYKLAKKYSIPLINIIGEDYPIKNYDYLTKKLKMSFIYKCFKYLLYKYSRKAIFNAKVNIFNTPTIEKEYKDAFGNINSAVVYPPADYIKKGGQEIKSNIILYAGNLGVGRDKALFEFAEELKKYDKNKMIHVYSKPDSKLEKQIKEYSNIIFKGYITNENLNKKILEAEMLIHFEYNSPYNVIDLKTAFSTKIANNIFYGNKFFMYAPKGLAESDFFINFLPDNIATEKNQIFEKLKNIFGKNNKINDVIKKSFDIKKTSEKIRNLILY